MTAGTEFAPADTAREIVATRLFDAPRDLVFRMWTEPDHVKQWWGPQGFTNTIHEMDVRPGGVWRFVMHGPDGTDYNNKIVYREVDPPSLLSYSHVSGPLFDAVVRFTERDGRTEVTVRMVFESAALREKVVADFGAVEGLHQTLDRLAGKLSEAQSGPRPFVISRTFDAPRDLVFRAWTEREHLSQWWGPKDFEVFSCTNDLRPGGMMHYGMRMPDGGAMWGKWLYREIVPPERLVFINAFSDEQGGLGRHPLAPEWPQQMLSTITFTETGGKTTVTVHWTAFEATEEERATFDAGHASMQQGWTGTFDRFRGYLARG